MDNNFDPIVKEKPNAELLKMVYQFDQWDAKMLAAVEKELQQRNMLPNDIAERKAKLVEEEEARLSQGKPATIGGQIFGWLGVFGVFGLIIGYNYAFSKVRSSYTGKKYYRYNKDARDNGNYIFYTCLAALIIAVFYKIVTLT